MAGKAHHAFSGYNKFASNGTLIGNYVEERALDNATGCHRYPRWVDHSEVSDTVYAKTVKGPVVDGVGNTFHRCIDHTDRLDESQWVSQTRDTFKGPNRPDGEVAYSPIAKLGRREQKELERLYQKAAQMPEEQKLPHTHATEQRDQYTQKDMAGMKIGARVMQTQDRLETTQRDPTFLAEHNIISRAAVDRMMPGGQMKMTARPEASPAAEGEDGVPYYRDLGVSVYTEAVHAGGYKGTRVFGTKITGGVSPFAKNCDFSKPLGEYNKVVDDE